RRRRAGGFASLEALEQAPDPDDPEATLARLMALIQALEPTDRQVVLLYLEDLDAAAIGEITGLSAGAVATKIHRLKALLARRFAEGGRHADRTS
ncbi:MAG: sigE, partial [Phenylobacterium sp.]|nr:sigE [Phenylobacterium sp.]